MAKPDKKANGSATGALCHCGRPLGHRGKHRGATYAFPARLAAERNALQAKHDKLATSIRTMQSEAQSIRDKLLALKALEEAYGRDKLLALKALGEAYGSAQVAAPNNAAPAPKPPAAEPIPPNKGAPFRIGQRSY